jgi:hypothetical protein
MKDLLKFSKFASSSRGGFQGGRKFYDGSIEQKSKKRDKKKNGALNFIQEGSFIKKGEVFRKKLAMNEIDSKFIGGVSRISGEESKDLQSNILNPT